MTNLEVRLIETYSAVSTSVDRVAASAEERARFRRLLPLELQTISDDELVRKLLSLRKKGKLPRRKQSAGV